MPRGNGSLRDAFGTAFAGIGRTWRTERNLRIQTVFAFLACGLGWFVALSGTQWAVLLLTIGAVIATELINTSIEAVVDLVSPDEHRWARTAKDASAGGVLVMAIVSVAVGLCLFVPPLLDRWR